MLPLCHELAGAQIGRIQMITFISAIHAGLYLEMIASTFAAVISANYLINVYRSSKKNEVKTFKIIQTIVLLGCWAFAGVLFIWFFLHEKNSCILQLLFVHFLYIL